MNTMAAALMKAKVVTEEDIRLTEKREKEERNRVEAQKLKKYKADSRIASALSSFDGKVVDEVRAFMKEHPGFLSIDILETMANCSMGESAGETRENSKREWSKLLSVLHGSKQTMVAS